MCGLNIIVIAVIILIVVLASAGLVSAVLSIILLVGITLIIAIAGKPLLAFFDKFTGYSDYQKSNKSKAKRRPVDVEKKNKRTRTKTAQEESPQLSTITCTECGKDNSAGMESNVHGQICCHCSRQPVVLTVAAAQYR